MTFVITYIFVGSCTVKGSTWKPDSNGGSTPKTKKIVVELRSIKPPVGITIDPLALDCITTEVYHSRVLMDNSIPLYASLPTWLTDYFNLNETKSLIHGRREKVTVLKLFIQISSDTTKFGEMLKKVNFKEISERQKYILGKLFKPFFNLPIIGINRYHKKESSIMSRPTRVGYFSIEIRNKKGVFFSDKSQLRYYNPPENIDTLLDLASNFDQFAHWCRTPPERDIVRWYWENGDSIRSIDNEPNIITDSRTLTTIMASPTNSLDDWEILACKFAGKIFMHEIDTHQRIERVRNQTSLANLSSYAGYRFEQLVTKRYNGKNNTLYDGGLRDSFHTVNIANIGRHKLVYSARCTAVHRKDNVNDPIDDLDIVDVKTRSGKGSWESRKISLWAKSILNRVSRVYIGEKNSKFEVTKITPIPTHMLLPRGYNRGALFDFLQKTLNFITDTCKVEKGVYRFYHTPFFPVIVQKMDMPIESVIPRWYVHGECPGR